MRRKRNETKKRSQFGRVANGRWTPGRRLRRHHRRARGGSRPPVPSVRAARTLDDPLDVHVHAMHVIVGRGRERPVDRFPKVVAGHGAVQPVVALHRAPAQEFHFDGGAQLGRATDVRGTSAPAPFRVERLPAPAVAKLQSDRRHRLDSGLAFVSLLRIREKEREMKKDTHTQIIIIIY